MSYTLVFICFSALTRAAITCFDSIKTFPNGVTINVCYDTTFYRTADLGQVQANQTSDLQKRCESSCLDNSRCSSYALAIQVAADSNLATGTCFFHDDTPQPRSCTDNSLRRLYAASKDPCVSSTATSASTAKSSTSTAATKTFLAAAPAAIQCPVTVTVTMTTTVLSLTSTSTTSTTTPSITPCSIPDFNVATCQTYTIDSTFYVPDLFEVVYSTMGYITNPSTAEGNNKANSDGHHELYTNYTNTLSARDAAEACAQVAFKEDYGSFDLRFFKSTCQWECVQYYGPSYYGDYSEKDPDALMAYGWVYA